MMRVIAVFAELERRLIGECVPGGRGAGEISRGLLLLPYLT